MSKIQLSKTQRDSIIAGLGMTGMRFPEEFDDSKVNLVFAIGQVASPDPSPTKPQYLIQGTPQALVLGEQYSPISSTYRTLLANKKFILQNFWYRLYMDIAGRAAFNPEVLTCEIFYREFPEVNEEATIFIGLGINQHYVGTHVNKPWYGHYTSYQSHSSWGTTGSIALDAYETKTVPYAKVQARDIRLLNHEVLFVFDSESALPANTTIQMGFVAEVL